MFNTIQNLMIMLQKQRKFVMFVGFVMVGRWLPLNGSQVKYVQVTLDQSGACNEEPIFIHFDYEGYESIFLGKPDEHHHFKTHRMIPTGDIEYFYTANSIQVAS